MLDVAAIRNAFMSPQVSRTLFAANVVGSANLTSLSRTVEEAWSSYQQGDLGRVVALLPALIKASREIEQIFDASSTERKVAAAISARVHHLAATTLSRIGETDYAWISAEHAMRAADEADDPLVLASAARAGTHALLAAGRFDDAIELGEAAARWLSPRMANGDPAALSLYGMLHLRTAMASARRQDRATTEELLTHASRAADELGIDANYWHTGFGPTNVELHRLAASLEFGDIAKALASAPRIDVSRLPLERQVTYLIDFARALSLDTKDEQSLQVLLDAEAKSPTIVRNSGPVREVVRSLRGRAPVTGGAQSSLLFSFAERCGAVA
jgi:tetratricopeptide (TPR) repeat protein